MKLSNKKLPFQIKDNRNNTSISELEYIKEEEHVIISPAQKLDETINFEIDAERPKSAGKKRKTIMMGSNNGSVKEINKFVKHLKTEK